MLAKETDVSVFQKRFSGFIGCLLSQIFVYYINILCVVLSKASRCVYLLYNVGNLKQQLILYVTTEQWAKCYCHFNHGDTDTDMYLETCRDKNGLYMYVYIKHYSHHSLHNQLNTVHLNGKINCRVEFWFIIFLSMKSMLSSDTRVLDSCLLQKREGRTKSSPMWPSKMVKVIYGQYL